MHGNIAFHAITFSTTVDEHDPEQELTLVFFQDVTAQVREAETLRDLALKEEQNN